MTSDPGECPAGAPLVAGAGVADPARGPESDGGPHDGSPVGPDAQAEVAAGGSAAGLVDSPDDGSGVGSTGGMSAGTSHAHVLDLLAGAADALSGDGPSGRTLDGYGEVGPALAVNLPQGWQVRVSPLAGRPGALLVENDLAPWISLEAWLPTAAGPAPAAEPACRVEIALRAPRDVAAEVFLRAMDGDAPQGDGPPFRLVLGMAEGAEARPAPPPAAVPLRHRLIMLLRNPPAEFVVDRLRLALTVCAR